MVINLQTKVYETQSTQPNTNFYPENENMVLLKEFEENEKGEILQDKPNPLVEIVVNSWLEHKQGCFDIVHENGIVTDIIPTEPIELEETQAETDMTEQEIISEIKRLAKLL